MDRDLKKNPEIFSGTRQQLYWQEMEVVKLAARQAVLLMH